MVDDFLKNCGEELLVIFYFEELVLYVIMKMRKFNIFQILVLKDNEIVGLLNDIKVYELLVDNLELKDILVLKVMGNFFFVVQGSMKLEEVVKFINNDVFVVIVQCVNGSKYILIRQDIIVLFV